MKSIKIHDLASAPEASKPLLEDSVKSFGMLPNLHGALAGSPALLDIYKRTHQAFQTTSFDAEELTVVWQTINVEHECHYCVPAHTAIAHMMKVSPELIEALRNQTALPTPKLQALHDFTLAIVRKRGHVSTEDLTAFYEAGYQQENVLEIILGLAQKVISNYTNHIAQTPVDEPFKKFAWEKSAEPVS